MSEHARFDVYEQIGERSNYADRDKVDEPTRTVVNPRSLWQKFAWRVLQIGLPGVVEMGLLMSSGYYDVNAVASDVRTVGVTKPPEPGTQQGTGLALMDLTSVGWDKVMTTESGRREMIDFRDQYNECIAGTVPPPQFRRKLEASKDAMYPDLDTSNPDSARQVNRVIAALVDACTQKWPFRRVVQTPIKQGGLGIPVSTYRADSSFLDGDKTQQFTPVPSPSPEQ